MNPVGTLENAKAANPLIQLQTFGQSICSTTSAATCCRAANCSA